MSIFDKRFDSIRIVRRIRGGAINDLFLVDDSRKDSRRPRVLKTLKPRHLNTPKHLDAFERECMILCGLDHLNIIRGIDYGNFNGVPALLMEYFEGKHIDHKTYFRQRDVGFKILHITQQIVEALRYLHVGVDHRALRGTIVHGDLGLHNVLVDSKLSVKILDFQKADLRRDTEGATRRHSGNDAPPVTVHGMTAFLAPEFLTTKDCLTDIYAIGATMVALLTGVLLFSQTRRLPTRFTVDATDVNRPLSPEESARIDALEIAARAAAFERDDRFQCADEFLDALVDAVDRHRRPIQRMLRELSGCQG